MGHIDEIGLIVTHIDDQGYLWFGSVGGWDAQILVGQRVVLDTRAGKVTGVVGKKPIHLLRDDERKKVAEIRDLHIDIGARDGDDARERVRIGDVAVIDAGPVELPNGRLLSRALDNRLGSFVALEAARLVAEAGGAEWELAAVAVAQEEITFGGSSTSAYRPAAGRGDRRRRHPRDRRAGNRREGDRQARARLGAGDQPRLDAASAAVRVALRDGRAGEDPVHGRGQRARTGTDADAVHISRAGVPTGLVSIPIRYMHSPVELVQLDDVHACARLIAAAALRLDGDATFSALGAAVGQLGHLGHLVRLARGSRRSRASAGHRDPRRPCA